MDAKAYAFLPTSNESILATNRLLDGGSVPLWRATAPFQDSGRGFGTGTVIFVPEPAAAEQLADEYGLTVFALTAAPDTAVAMRKARVVTYASEGAIWFLKAFGFDAHSLSTEDQNGTLDLSKYDVLVTQSDLSSGVGQPGLDALETFFARGGDFVGIGRYGTSAGSQFGLTPGVMAVSLSGNGIVRVNYGPMHTISAQYPAESYGFVYRPVFFTNAGHMEIAASIPSRDDFFVSGYWSGWQDSGADGQPVVLHGVQGSSNVTLIGLDPTFRAHPEHTFRLLANAIFSWQE